MICIARGAVELNRFLHKRPKLQTSRFSAIFSAVNLSLYFTHTIKAVTFQLISQGTRRKQRAFYARNCHIF